MKIFIESKFGKNQEISQKLEEKVLKPFYHCLNKLEISPPTTSSNPYEISATDRIHSLNFKRWKFYCREKKGQQQLKVQDIFGKTMLKMMYRVFQIVNSNHEDAKLLLQKISPEMDSISIEFYKLF